MSRPTGSSTGPSPYLDLLTGILTMQYAAGFLAVQTADQQHFTCDSRLPELLLHLYNVHDKSQMDILSISLPTINWPVTHSAAGSSAVSLQVMLVIPGCYCSPGKYKINCSRWPGTTGEELDKKSHGPIESQIYLETPVNEMTSPDPVQRGPLETLFRTSSVTRESHDHHIYLFIFWQFAIHPWEKTAFIHRYRKGGRNQDSGGRKKKCPRSVCSSIRSNLRWSSAGSPFPLFCADSRSPGAQLILSQFRSELSWSRLVKLDSIMNPFSSGTRLRWAPRRWCSHSVGSDAVVLLRVVPLTVFYGNAIRNCGSVWWNKWQLELASVFEWVSHHFVVCAGC